MSLNIILLLKSCHQELHFYRAVKVIGHLINMVERVLEKTVCRAVTVSKM